MEVVTCWRCGEQVPAEQVCRNCRAADPGVPRAPVQEAAALAVVRFPWGPFTVMEGADLYLGREEGQFATELVGYPRISRRHLRIQARDGALYVTDLLSRNGTFVDDVRLQPHVEVAVVDGQRVRMGLSVDIAVEPAQAEQA